MHPLRDHQLGRLASITAILTVVVYVGLAQRLLEASVLAWVLACGLYVRRRASA